MTPFIENCIIADQVLSAFRVQKLLEYPHLMTVFLLDIQLLVRQIEALGQEYANAQYLSGCEQVTMGALTSEKRKKEWLSGRIAAKYAAAGLFEQGHGERDNVLSFPDLTIIADKNGRPSLKANNHIRMQGDIPDISISHSVSIAAAMAAEKGFCGIDIQKITHKVIKVQERFCCPAEKRILQATFPWQAEKETAALTKLWAAKEALRKASNMVALPGFLEMELIEIHEELPQEASSSWVYVFSWKRMGTPINHKYRVAVTLVKDYALALTARDDTLQ